MYYYVYLIKFSSNQFYIGSRTSKVTPEDDTKYWGSPKTYKHLWKDTTLEKTKHILKICSDFNEMRELEVKLIKEAWKKFPNKCLNRCAAPMFHHDAYEKSARTNQEKYSKEYIIKSPKGEIIKGKNINKFCKENNLDHAAIIRVFSGKVKSHKGWKLPETDKIGYELLAETNSHHFCLKSPKGEIIKGKNIRKFCRENNLLQASINGVLLGKRKSHRGWTLPETTIIDHDIVAEKRSKEFILKSPTGDIIIGKNIRKFCRENNLNQGAICSLFSGKVKSHKGWTLP